MIHNTIFVVVVAVVGGADGAAVRMLCVCVYFKRPDVCAVLCCGAPEKNTLAGVIEAAKRRETLPTRIRPAVRNIHIYILATGLFVLILFFFFSLSV